MSHPDIQPGKYKARATQAVLGTTSKGTEQIAVELVFLGGQYDGKHITWYGFFSDQTVERTLDSLRHLGWSSDNLIDLSGIDANEVEIVVEDETNDKGEVRSRVRWINRISGPALKNRMNPAEIESFSKRMAGRIVEHRKQMGQPKAGNGNTAKRGDAPPPHDDTDIPF